MQKMVQVAGTGTWGDDTTKQKPGGGRDRPFDYGAIGRISLTSLHCETDLLIAVPGKMGRAHNSMHHIGVTL